MFLLLWSFPYNIWNIVTKQLKTPTLYRRKILNHCDIEVKLEKLSLGIIEALKIFKDSFGYICQEVPECSQGVVGTSEKWYSEEETQETPGIVSRKLVVQDDSCRSIQSTAGAWLQKEETRKRCAGHLLDITYNLYTYYWLESNHMVTQNWRVARWSF